MAYLNGLIVVDDPYYGDEQPEDTYTLPVEVFESTVVVQRPEPAVMPISADLGYTAPQSFLSSHLFSWLAMAAVSSVLFTGASRRRRKKRAA